MEMPNERIRAVKVMSNRIYMYMYPYICLYVYVYTHVYMFIYMFMNIYVYGRVKEIEKGTESMLEKKKLSCMLSKCENTSNKTSINRKKKMAENFPEMIKGNNFRSRKPNKSPSG